VSERAKKIELINAALMAKAPLLGHIARHLRIRVTDEIPFKAATNGLEILLSPEFFESPDQEKVFILAHEAAHVVLRHPSRGIGKVMMPWQIAADVAANELLAAHKFSLPSSALRARDIYRMTGVDPDKIREMSAEAIYELLVKRGRGPGNEYGDLFVKVEADSKGVGSGQQDLRPPEGSTGGGEEEDEKGGGGFGGESVIQEGSITDEDKLLIEIAKAVSYAKAVGNLPGAAERAVTEFFKPKADWRALLRDSIREGVRRAFRTWMRPSRKGEGLPSYRLEGKCVVYALIDTSGSISEEELTQFAGEVYAGIGAQAARVYVVPWDADTYGVHEAKTKAQIVEVFKKYLKGGGGTLVVPAIREVDRHSRHHNIKPDAVAILTDGYWFEEDESVARALRPLAARGAKIIVCTTGREPAIPHATIVKI